MSAILSADVKWLVTTAHQNDFDRVVELREALRK